MAVTEFVSTAGAVRSTTLLPTPSNRVQLRPIHAPPRRPGIPLYFRSALLSSAAEPCERISPLCPRLPVLLHSLSDLLLQNRISAKVVLERHFVCQRHVLRPEKQQSEQAVGHRESCSVYGSGLQGGHEARGAPTPLVRPEQGLWRGLSLASLPPRLPTSQSCVLIHHRFPPWTPVAPNRRSSPDHLSFPCSSDHDDSPDLNNIAHAIPNTPIW